MYFDLNLPHDGDIESLRARLATALSMGARPELFARSVLTFFVCCPLTDAAVVGAGNSTQRKPCCPCDAGYTTVAVTFVTDRAKLTHDHVRCSLDSSGLLGLLIVVSLCCHLFAEMRSTDHLCASPARPRPSGS